MSDPKEHTIEAHAGRIGELIRELESSDPQIREKVFELVANIDHLHRTCVWRLFELTTELGGKGLVDRLASDSAVKMLFMLYDLIPTEPLTPIRATESTSATASTAGFVPLASLRKRQPVWQVVFEAGELVPGTMHGVDVEGTPVLLLSLEGKSFAFRNACVGTALPLHLGMLAGSVIRCPWHGCQYDAHTGKRLDGQGGDLEPFDVKVEEKHISISARRSK